MQMFRDGAPTGEIVRVLGVPRKTVWYWKSGRCRGGIRLHFRNNTKLQRHMGESATVLSPVLSYLLGALDGDGSVREDCILLTVTDEEFAAKVRDALCQWSGLPARPVTKHVRGASTNWKPCYTAALHSVEAARFVLAFDRDILLTSASDIQCAYLRGIFDAEGCVVMSRDYRTKARWDRSVCLKQKNPTVVVRVSRLLTVLDIAHRITTEDTHTRVHALPTRHYQIVISRFEALQRFYALVGFSIYRKQQKLAAAVALGISKRRTEKKPAMPDLSLLQNAA